MYLFIKPEENKMKYDFFFKNPPNPVDRELTTVRF